MKELVSELCARLARQQTCVLVTVGCQSGSTPREAGARMLVFADNSTWGTIGGGLVEAMAIQGAAACLAERKGLQRQFDLSNADAAGTDMICGGRMDLYLEYIAASPDNLEFFQSLHNALRHGRRMVVASEQGGDGPRFLCDSQGQCHPRDLEPELEQVLARSAATLSGAALLQWGKRTFLLSAFALGGTLVLVGAGHVAACTAEVAARVGFRITVLDDRAEFANQRRFPQAETIHVLPDFTHCFEGLGIDRDSYIVIVTRGHLHDKEALEQALATQAGYIGMIGSRKKRDAIYEQLLDKGMGQARLEQVHCPIGLAIEADTPEEIAISIVGELIAHRATGRRAWRRS